MTDLIDTEPRLSAGEGGGDTNPTASAHADSTDSNPPSSLQSDPDSPFRGASRISAILAKDPELDPNLPHECHCLRCDYYWTSKPGVPFPPRVCARCHSTSWTKRPTPKQREYLATRTDQIREARALAKAARRRYWLAARARLILTELGINSREVGEIAEEILITRKTAMPTITPEEQRKMARQTAIGVLSDPRPQAANKVAEAISTLLPPPPQAPLEWRMNTNPASSTPPTQPNPNTTLGATESEDSNQG